jgi:hypothetical protein
MKMSEAFPSKYLKAADIKGREINLKLASVEMEDLGDEVKPVLYFIGKDKGIVLNKTNSEILTEAYGDESGDWHGKPVILTTHRVKNPRGETVDGFTFRIPVKATSDDEAPF